MPRAPHLTTSVAVSALLHVIVLALVWRATPSAVEGRVVIPVALVGRFGGGGGGSGGGDIAPGPPPADTLQAAPTPPPPAAPAPRARRPRPVPSPSVLAHVAPPSPPADTAPAPSETPGEATASGGDRGSTGGSGGSGDGRGGGDGTGGDGSGGARVAYGANPLPPYPIVARRLGKEGVVLLEVLVAADGSASDVRIVQSSGFGPLDESALATVRSRWRFVPARRDGTPIASRVTVPIRFRLDRSGEG